MAVAPLVQDQGQQVEPSLINALGQRSANLLYGTFVEYGSGHRHLCLLRRCEVTAAARCSAEHSGRLTGRWDLMRMQGRDVVLRLFVRARCRRAPSKSACTISRDHLSSGAQYFEISANDSSGLVMGNIAPPPGAPAGNPTRRCGAGLVRLQTLSASITRR